ncbi:hypothetical protein K9L97_03855 [Candidatus Woesearchaeota archaeon]|nr:hypothetical protein [Candidatus Woesearchaeota archaeon]
MIYKQNKNYITKIKDEFTDNWKAYTGLALIVSSFAIAEIKTEKNNYDFIDFKSNRGCIISKR